MAWDTVDLDRQILRCTGLRYRYGYRYRCTGTGVQVQVYRCAGTGTGVQVSGSGTGNSHRYRYRCTDVQVYRYRYIPQASLYMYSQYRCVTSTLYPRHFSYVNAVVCVFILHVHVH